MSVEVVPVSTSTAFASIVVLVVYGLTRTPQAFYISTKPTAMIIRADEARGRGYLPI